MNLVEPFIRVARQQPDRPAIIVGAQTLTYRALLSNVAKMAASFEADGVRTGHRVLVVAGPLNTVIATLALAWLGAVSADKGSTQDEKLGELAQELDLDAVYHVRDVDLGGSRARAGRIDRLPQVSAISGAVKPPPMWNGSPDALWRIVVSSGTTGRPKGIACSYASIVNVHLLRTVYPTGPGDVVVLAMSAAMGFAIHNWLRCLYTGGCALLAELLEPAQLLALLQGGQGTHCMSTPATANALAALCTQPDAPPPAPARRLHTFSTGGGRLSAGARAALAEHLCPNVVAHYGAAEAQIVAVLDSQLAQTNPGCTGRLLPWVEAHAVGPEGQVLPAGEVGRLRFRSPTLASGYVGHVDDDAFRDGWFLSQDRGMVRPDGIVVLHGRANDVINIAGRKVDPELIEEAIMADRNILECVVVAIEGPLGPELVAVIVDPSKSADLDALAERCKKATGIGRLSRVLRTSKLPRNANGKIMRNAVRASVRKGMQEARSDS
jgi:acyl-coenzyme A synthetase/AMP-(fatty) acid ligase